MTDPEAAARARLKNFWRRLLVGLFLVVLFAWLALRPGRETAPGEDAEHLVYQEIYALGTLISVTLWLDDPDRRADARARIDALEGELGRFHARWSAWGDGPLGTVNRALLAGQRAEIPEPLRGLAAESFALHARTAGRFDPRVGALVRLWGFDDPSHFRRQPPDDADIAAALEALQAAPEDYRGAAHWGPAAGVAWDFGAIAKGRAMELASAGLREAGYADHIVNAGGNLVVSGRRGPRHWRVGIRDPRGDTPTSMLGALETHGHEAVITSGDYERYFEYQGQRYHHIIDPRSGRPARGLRAVTVLADDAALADAASTALFVAGPEHWPSVARALGVREVLVVDDAGQLQVTPGLLPRLRLQPGLRPQTVELPD